MDTEKVTLDLNKRFSAPLPEYYKRRIIFWLDEDREFEDRLDEIPLRNVQLVRLTGRNAFAVKKLIGHDDPYSNFLIYCPISYEKLDDNWLLDVQLYSEEFRADLVSIWMDEMHILSSQALRKLVKAYRKFFNAKDRRSRIAGLQGTVNTPAQLHLAIMAAICGLKNSQPASILRAVLNAGLSTESNSLYAELVSYGAKDAFWAMVAQATGYSEVDVDLGALACHVLTTACTRTMNADNLAGLERYISLPHQAWCFDLVSDWLHSDEKQGLYVVARHVEEALLLHDRFMQMQVSELADTECFPCVNECILEKLMQDVSHQIIDADTIAATVEKRRTCVWYDAVSAFYDGMMQVANMQRFFTEHAAGFHIVEARNIWKEYTTDYYRMDGYYRQFHLCYAQSIRIFKEHLNDLFAKVAEQVEGLYVHWFLEKLGENWTKAIEDDLRNHGRILEVPQQTEFYESNVRATDSNVVVIISDALRYEVAASLTEQLRRETQSKIELTAMQGIFPTITKFGMAALLPHKKLTVEERANGTLAVLADGIPTDSSYREKVLRAANPNSIVIKCEDVIGKTAEQLRAETNGKEVVYIYHDTIDAASHASDSMVFPACETAIQELKTLIRHATNKLNRTHVFVTGDHGFLYTFKPLKEDSKIDKTSFNQMDVEYGRRYAIMREGAAPDYLMPVRFMDGNTGLTAFTPRESMRIKMQGGGLNFVHGGVSLQELCVPLIAYHRLRNEYKEYQRHRSKYDTKPVTISLLSASRKISNMIFSLNFYQREAVGDNRCAQTYNLSFTDEYGKPISDTQKIIADKTGESNQDRTFRCTFNLKQLKYSSTATYYLVIADEQGLMMPQREEFHIDIAFAVDEFDFFS